MAKQGIQVNNDNLINRVATFEKSYYDSIIKSDAKINLNEYGIIDSSKWNDTSLYTNMYGYYKSGLLNGLFGKWDSSSEANIPNIYYNNKLIPFAKSSAIPRGIINRLNNPVNPTSWAFNEYYREYSEFNYTHQYDILPGELIIVDLCGGGGGGAATTALPFSLWKESAHTPVNCSTPYINFACGGGGGGYIQVAFYNSSTIKKSITIVLGKGGSPGKEALSSEGNPTKSKFEEQQGSNGGDSSIKIGNTTICIARGGSGATWMSRANMIEIPFDCQIDLATAGGINILQQYVRDGYSGAPGGSSWILNESGSIDDIEYYVIQRIDGGKGGAYRDPSTSWKTTWNSFGFIDLANNYTGEEILEGSSSSYNTPYKGSILVTSGMNCSNTTISCFKMINDISETISNDSDYLPKGMVVMNRGYGSSHLVIPLDNAEAHSKNILSQIGLSGGGGCALSVTARSNNGYSCNIEGSGSYSYYDFNYYINPEIFKNYCKSPNSLFNGNSWPYSSKLIINEYPKIHSPGIGGSGTINSPTSSQYVRYTDTNTSNIGDGTLISVSGEGGPGACLVYRASL